MDRWYEPPQPEVSKRPRLAWLLLWLVAAAVILPLAYWDSTDANLIEQRKRYKSESLQRESDRLRGQAVAALPPDATEVTVVRDDWPVGWLTFVRVEGGKPVKFLVCYTRVQATGEMTLSVTRAD